MKTLILAALLTASTVPALAQGRSTEAGFADGLRQSALDFVRQGAPAPATPRAGAADGSLTTQTVPRRTPAPASTRSARER